MKRILPWFWFPLAMLMGGFAAECLISGVDLNTKRTGDIVRVYTTNNTYRCAMFQWNRTLATNGWYDYHGYFAGPLEPVPCTNLEFSVKADTNRVFWRLKNCANP